MASCFPSPFRSPVPPVMPWETARVANVPSVVGDMPSLSVSTSSSVLSMVTVEVSVASSSLVFGAVSTPPVFEAVSSLVFLTVTVEVSVPA